MKNPLLILIVLLTLNVHAQPANLPHAPHIENSDDRAAGCSPASASTFLEFNNVKALIHTGGNLWQISGQNLSQYEVPKGSGIMALFTSALWLGGIDINGQLKIAAVRYRDGQDYWTGPLTTAGDAEIIPEECSNYDRHFVITQDEVREFDAWFKAGEQDDINGTNTQIEKFPDYEFSLIMGEDNLKSFHKWKNHELILKHHSIYVYPRLSQGKIETQFNNHPKILNVSAPIMELSSTFIRKEIAAGKNIRPMLPENVWQYIDEMNFYKS